MQKIIFTLLLMNVLSVSFAQNLNVELFDVANRGDQRYSGSWTYVGANGAEYALVGAYTGLAAYSIDEAPITEVGFVGGPGSNWREITVVKDHAYVTTEGTGGGQGLQVISLEYLPDSLHLVRTYGNFFFRAHILQSDVYNPDSEYIYVNGSTTLGTPTVDGVIIFDVSNPADIQVVGGYHPYYIHDCHVRGDRLYASAIYEGTLDVVDISDKSNPQLITRISYPTPFTHSSWTSPDHNYIYVCDEVDGLPMRTFDISDVENITEITQAQYTANSAALVHNPYVRGNFLFASHNTEGLRVLDISRPDVPVEVGFYDTYTGPSGGYNGLWSACPFLPSGKIIGGDRKEGLYVWQFNDTKAGHIYGIVRDEVSGATLSATSVTLTNTILTDLDGKYATGASPGTYSMTFERADYEPQMVENIELQSNDSLWIEVALTPIDVGVNEPLYADLIEVFPNPFDDKITVDVSKLPMYVERFVLYDLNGKIIKTFVLNNSLSGQYNTNELNAGIYFYKILNEKNEMISYGKMVK